MKKGKLISIMSAMALTMSMGVSASAFSDMPTGEMGAALQKAVDAGLINGVTDDTIAPYDNITRAQMAAIITRAFSVTGKSDMQFGDVSQNDWYADTVAKAVYMGAFEGDDNNNFNPEKNITFQETYLVLSRVFRFEPYAKKSNGFLVGDCDESVLDEFPDKDEIAPWAKNGAKYIVGNGKFKGFDGKLRPNEYITRGEFAMIMDEIVDTYIDEPGEYKNLTDGLIMVRCGGVTIDGLKSNHNLVITYGVDEKGCEVKNSVVNGVTVVLGGVDKTPVEKKDGMTGEIKMLPDESHISLGGQFYDVRVEEPYIYVDAQNMEYQYYRGIKGTFIARSFG